MTLSDTARLFVEKFRSVFTNVGIPIRPDHPTPALEVTRMALALDMVPFLCYLLVLTGGVNWLVTAIRLTATPLACESGSGELAIPDSLGWVDTKLQLATYYAVGAASAVLMALLPIGYSIRKGEPIITCERV